MRGTEGGRAVVEEEVIKVEPVILRCSGQPRALPNAMDVADHTKVRMFYCIV